MLYACDRAWWEKFGGCPEFKGIKLTADQSPLLHKWGIQPVAVDKKSDQLELSKFGTVGWGGNSGFQALNVAVQFMCRRIILVGYDMSLKNGVHWHGKHPKGMNNPHDGNIARWRRCLDAAADTLDAVGVEVINASHSSALERYPKMTLMEAFDHHARHA
ncbi:hypothetical protein ABK249_02760 [Neorhizobium sp. Rsf11]|uniref:Uncharacterized protein n=1 Tax=Neorhizobium phenanthreniclasticum TaxID=3157917 RepID=A0ABV0LW68_9HYPH